MTSFVLPLIAHAEAGPRDWPGLARAWEVEPLVLLLLVASAWVYRRGAQRWRAATPQAGGLRPWQQACYWVGWATLAVALASPLHPWGQVLFAAHMTQHELLMVVAAPLLVLGRPGVAFLFALPRGEARVWSRVARRPGARTAWAFVTDPLVAWLLHAAALWLWHVPLLFQATLRQPLVHDLQHASFFGTALLFWWSLLRRGWSSRALGAAVLFLFTTMVHSGLLGALILFADRLIYPDYAASAGDWGLTPLEDQQLGGLIMWVPAGLVYVLAGLILLAGWLRRTERPLPLARGLRPVARILPICLMLLGAGCERADPPKEEEPITFNPDAGRRTIRILGCGTCHEIPGVPAARGRVGPSLAGFGSRQTIGGVLPNTTANLVDWLMDPPAHAPRTLMPAVVPDVEDARDIAAYLSTLRDAR